MRKSAVEQAKEVKIVEKFGLKADEMNDMFMAYQGDMFILSVVPLIMVIYREVRQKR